MEHEFEFLKGPLSAKQVPIAFYRDFLDADLHARLLAFALAHETDFEPSGVGLSKINPAYRVSSINRRMGPLRKEVRDIIRAHLPDFCNRFGMRNVDESRIEVEMAAHGDGAFYVRHIDTRTGDSRIARAISAVYYFFRQPKMFAGGELRMFAFGSPDSARYLDVEPQDNLLAVFPSFIPHEVRPVSVPSGRFEDNRFAINIWTHAILPKGAGS